MKKLFSNKKSHAKKSSNKELKLLSFSKASMLLIASVTALTGGVYAISQSFAYTDSKGRLWATYGIQVRQMHSTGLIQGATVGVAGYYDGGIPAGETCNSSHDAGNLSGGYRYQQTDGSGYAWFTCITRNTNGQRISYRLASLNRADYTATTDGPSSAPSVCGGTPCINIGSTVLNPASSGTSIYATYMYGRPGVPTIVGADRAQTSLTLRWNTVNGATGYSPTRSGWSGPAGTSNTWYTFAGLACGTTYNLSVSAYAPGLASGYATQPFATAACSVVSAPAGSTQTAQPTAPVPSTKPTNTSTSSRTVSRAQPVAVVGDSSDTTPPSAPGSLTATEGSGGTVVLSWAVSTDNKAVKAYVVERSTDGQNWTTLSDSITAETYTDSGTSFNTKYTYRVSAKDEAGNGSDYTLVDITTSAFEANAFADKESTITSEDKVVSVKIPTGALSVDANCKISTPSDEVSGLSDNYSVLAGAYSFECKDKDGKAIDKYNKPLEFTVTPPESKSTPQIFAQSGDQWENSKLKYDGKVKGFSFTTDDPNNFAVVTKAGGTNMFLLVFGIIILLLAIVGIILWLLRRRRAQQEQLAGYPLDYFDQNPGGGPPNYPNANG